MSLTGWCSFHPLNPASNRMTTRSGSLVALLPLLVACAREPSADAFVPVADVQELMLHVLEPAAEHYWDAVGWVIDLDATTEIFPRSHEEWEAVVNAAYVVTESGNLLMMDPRRIDDGAWMSFSRALIEAGRVAISAAVAEDRDAVFDAGAEVYYACTACHSAYALETLRPNAVPTE